MHKGQLMVLEETLYIPPVVKNGLDPFIDPFTFDNPAPCNSMFRVEVSTEETFATGSTVTSRWMKVDTDPTTPDSPECYGTWTPTDAQWNSLQANGALSFIYYRARTQNDMKTNQRLSTRPGRLWQVPPPYAVITTDGESEY
jgi:hypothetical protein